MIERRSLINSIDHKQQMDEECNIEGIEMQDWRCSFNYFNKKEIIVCLTQKCKNKHAVRNKKQIAETGKK